MSILGIHHVTAIASDPQCTLDFYTRVLGLRFVKRTVNFDDPGTYHFYFGDVVGTPGTILTFFPWPGARPGRPGPGQVAVTSLAVRPDSLGFWIEQLIRHNVRYEGPIGRGSGPEAERVLSFRDPDGLLLEIVGHSSADPRPAWDGAPGVPAEHALRGSHAVTLWVDARPRDRAAPRRHPRFPPGARGRNDPPIRAGRRWSRSTPRRPLDRGVSAWHPERGNGPPHRVACGRWRRPARRPGARGARRPPRNPVIHRKYFESVYFREPGGVLFELATDAPGFAIDEPVERLGERLMLPEQFEPRRAEIEAALPQIHLPEPGRAERHL